eukprot:217057-Ditylum_brightwellii.AAC.1
MQHTLLKGKRTKGILLFNHLSDNFNERKIRIFWRYIQPSSSMPQATYRDSTVSEYRVPTSSELE